MSARNRPKRIVAVDWDSHTLRVVHAIVSKRGPTIDKLLSVGIPPTVDPNNPEQMGKHIQRTLDHEGISTRHAVVDVPRDQAILKTLALPTTRPDELPGMVEIQIAKELPFPVKEAVIDFAVSESAKDVASGDVLVAAVRRELLEQYEATFTAAGLKLARVGLRPYANKLAVCELLRHALPEKVLFIDVRPTFMEIDVLREGTLAFSRSASVTIPHGGEASTAAGGGAEQGGAFPRAVSDAGPASGDEATVPSLVLEVTRSIEAYRASDAAAKIDHVVIGGDLGVEEALAETLQRRLGTTAETYNPASTFGWEPDEGAKASAFAASLGLVLAFAGEDELHFDFLHPKRTVSISQQRLKKAPMVAAVAALFCTAFAVVLAESTRYDRKALAKLEADIAELSKKEPDYKKLLDFMGVITDFDEKQLVWVDVLRDIVSQLPSNQHMVVTQLEMNQKDRRVTLKTVAKERDTATSVMQALEAFRRDGRELPRFKVTEGSKTEKKRETYPFIQDLKIQVLDDERRAREPRRQSED